MHRLLLGTLLIAFGVASPTGAAQQPPSASQQRPAPTTVTPAQSPDSNSPPMRVGGNVPPPTKIRHVAPAYPIDAQRAGVQGVVIIEATIGEDGKVRSAAVLRSIPQLDQAALDAVKQWEFAPTIVGGKAVPVIMTVTVQFAMAPPSAAAFQQPGMLLLNVTRNADGTATVWQLEESRAAVLPRWDPETQSTPLTTPDAVRLARGWVTKRVTDVPRFELQSVTLQRPTTQSESPLWYYQVAFVGSRSATPQTRQVFSAIVLSDGSVVEPTTVETKPPNSSRDAGSSQR